MSIREQLTRRTEYIIYVAFSVQIIGLYLLLLRLVSTTNLMEFIVGCLIVQFFGAMGHYAASVFLRTAISAAPSPAHIEGMPDQKNERSKSL